MLKVVQAPLDLGLWPECRDSSESGSLPIRRKHKGIETAFFEIRKPSGGGVVPLFGNVEVGEDLLAGGIHEGHEAAVLVEVGGVQDQILERAEALRLWRQLLKPVVFDSLELGFAMAGQTGQLSDRIMFHDPELEPMLLIMLFVLPVLPDEGFGTERASESLLMIGALTKALNKARTAERTILFFS